MQRALQDPLRIDIPSPGVGTPPDYLAAVREYARVGPTRIQISGASEGVARRWLWALGQLEGVARPASASGGAAPWLGIAGGAVNLVNGAVGREPAGLSEARLALLRALVLDGCLRGPEASLPAGMVAEVAGYTAGAEPGPVAADVLSRLKAQLKEHIGKSADPAGLERIFVRKARGSHGYRLELTEVRDVSAPGDVPVHGSTLTAASAPWWEAVLNQGSALPFHLIEGGAECGAHDLLGTLKYQLDIRARDTVAPRGVVEVGVIYSFARDSADSRSSEGGLSGEPAGLVEAMSFALEVLEIAREQLRLLELDSEEVPDPLYGASVSKTRGAVLDSAVAHLKSSVDAQRLKSADAGLDVSERPEISKLDKPKMDDLVGLFNTRVLAAGHLRIVLLLRGFERLMWPKRARILELLGLCMMGDASSCGLRVLAATSWLTTAWMDALKLLASRGNSSVWLAPFQSFAPIPVERRSSEGALVRWHGRLAGLGGLIGPEPDRLDADGMFDRIWDVLVFDVAQLENIWYDFDPITRLALVLGACLVVLARVDGADNEVINSLRATLRSVIKNERGTELQRRGLLRMDDPDGVSAPQIPLMLVVLSLRVCIAEQGNDLLMEKTPWQDSEFQRRAATHSRVLSLVSTARKVLREGLSAVKQLPSPMSKQPDVRANLMPRDEGLDARILRTLLS